MAKLKRYKDYLREDLQRCGKKLASLKNDPVRYKRALSNINMIKKSMRKGIPKNVDNSIDLPVSLV
jgi:hypothetical protein